MMEKFHYKLPNNETVTLPRMEDLPLGIVRKTRRLERADQVFTMLESLLTEDELESFDEFTRKDFEKFMVAWREGSNLDLGESSAS